MKLELSTVSMFKNLKVTDSIELNDEQLKKLQTVLLGILADIDSFCKENDIQYFLGGGSALGAVRHSGFIPWDDDMDINMTRENYDKFICLFPKMMSNKYWLHTPEYTNNYALLLGRVRLKGTCVKTREDFFMDECGAFIDIFVVENTPNNKVLRGMHGFISLAFGFLLSCRKFFRERKHLKKILDDSNMLEFKFAYYIKVSLGFITAILSLNAWIKINVWWNSLCKNNNSKYVTVPAGRNHYFKELIERDAIFPTILHDFENYKFSIARTDKYLKQLYGDYKKIPSEAKREKHIMFKPFEI